MNSNIPIFDSLTHPTLDGNWILPKHPQKSNIDNLLADMEANNIIKALAVGMQEIGAYDENKYAQFILSKTDKLIPIAFFNINEFSTINEIKNKFKQLKTNGYKGIKLHPRMGQFSLKNKLLPSIIKLANEIRLTVLFCTYFYSNQNGSYLNSTENLIQLLENIDEAEIILLHSGGVKIFEYMEIARAFPNILLDLSFTISKYEGSSLDLDISYLFHTFDQRICIGSDNPQFSLSKLRERFNFFSKNIAFDKAENIAYRNIAKFVNY